MYWNLPLDIISPEIGGAPLSYQFISHPAFCGCCGGGLIEFVDSEQTTTLTPEQWISKYYQSDDAPVTLISEADLLNRKNEINLTDQEILFQQILLH